MLFDSIKLSMQLVILTLGVLVNPSICKDNPRMIWGVVCNYRSFQILIVYQMDVLKWFVGFNSVEYIALGGIKTLKAKAEGRQVWYWAAFVFVFILFFLRKILWTLTQTNIEKGTRKYKVTCSSQLSLAMALEKEMRGRWLPARALFKREIVFKPLIYVSSTHC